MNGSSCTTGKETRLTIEEAFGNVIRRLRKERMLSQDGLSMISSLDRGFISQLERGKQQPTLLTIFELAAALKVTTAKILNETELLLYFNKVNVLSNEIDFDSFEKFWNQLEGMLMVHHPDKSGQETILLVDDDVHIRDCLHKLLQMHGYSVIVAEDGQDAVEKYRAQADAIDMVLMDVMMPRVDGISAHKSISELNPQAKILLMSGYSSVSLAEVDNLQFIQKPLMPSKLLSNIRNILE